MVQLTNIASTARRGLLPSADLRVEGVSPGAFGADIGKGLQAVGGATAEVGQAVNAFQVAKAREAEQLADFDRQTTFVNFGSDQSTKLDEARRNLTGPAQDFTKSYMEGFDKDAASFLEAVPAGKPRAEWAARMAQMRAGVAREALGAEFQQRESWGRATTLDTLGKLQNGAMSSPEKLADWTAQGEQIIDASPMSAEAKTELKLRWRGQAAVAAATGDVQRDPEGAIARLGGLREETRLEATGKAPAPDGKFTGGWTPRARNGGDNTDAAVDNKITGVAKALGVGPDADISKLTPLQIAQALSFGEGGKGSLADRNNNPTNLRDARTGAYRKFGSTDEALQSAASQVSRNLKRGQTTVRSMIEGLPAAGGAAKPAASAPAAGPRPEPQVDPRYADLPFEARQQLVGAAQREIQQRQAVAAAGAQQAHADWLNTFLNEINDGKAGAADIEAARKSGRLTDFDEIRRAQQIVEDRTKKTADLDFFNAAIATPGFVFNPYDDRQKKGVEAAVKQGAAALGPNGQPVGAAGAAFNIWQRTGILADAGATALRGGLISTNPQAVQVAANYAGNMLRTNPNAFAAVQGGDEMEKAALAFNHYTFDLGLSPTEAAQRVAHENSPEFKSKLKIGQPVLDEYRKQIRKDGADDAAKVFGRRVGFLTDAKTAEANETYTELIVDQLRDGKDMQTAQAVAAGQMQKVYGVSRNGTVVSKYPPENNYPVINGSHDYVYADAVATVKHERGVDVAPADVHLVPIAGVTDQDFRNGQPARYALVYGHSVNGQMVLDRVPGFFAADTHGAARTAGIDRKAQFDATRAAIPVDTAAEALRLRSRERGAHGG